MGLLAPHLFNELCELSLIDIHLFSLHIFSGKYIAKTSKTGKILQPTALCCLLLFCFLSLDKFYFLYVDVILIVSSGLILLGQLNYMAELWIFYLSGLGLSYFFTNTEAVWGFYFSLSCMIIFFLFICFLFQNSIYILRLFDYVFYLLTIFDQYASHSFLSVFNYICVQNSIKSHHQVQDILCFCALFWVRKCLNII